MINHAYTVRDKAVGAFLPIFFVRSRGEAVRSFSDAVNDPGKPFNKHAGDFDLWYLGTFDDATGALALPDGGAPERVAGAIDVLIPVGSGESVASQLGRMGGN